MGRLAIAYDKNNETAYNNLGNIYSLNKANWQMAEQFYIKAIAINGKYSCVHANYGVLLRKMGRIEDSKHHYLCALEYDGANCAWIHFNFGNLMEEEFGNNESATVHYKRCLELDGKHMAAMHNLAVLL